MQSTGSARLHPSLLRSLRPAAVWAVSSIACLASIVLWAGGYHTGISALRDRGSHIFSLTSQWGSLQFRLLDVRNPPSAFQRMPRRGWVLERNYYPQRLVGNLSDGTS